MASLRSASLTILSKMRRCASRKKSFESMTSAAMLKASLCRRIAPRTERSASRLCGSVRSATAVGGIRGGDDDGRSGSGALAKPPIPVSRLRIPNPESLLLGAFGDDAHLQIDRDLAVQLHRHVVLANPFDRFGELQLAPIELEAFRRERVRDVRARHRAIECLGFADAARDLAPH